MPGLYEDQGVVLRRIKLGEADRIVTLYTAEHGKVRAVAKGVRKTKSRFGARLEPFTVADLIIYRGRDLDTITSADIVSSHDAVRTDLDALASASAFAELVDKITPDRDPAPQIYSLLLGGLDALGRGPTVLPAFVIKLLALAGFHPQLHSCAGCDEPAVAGFSSELGGAVCADCGREDPGAWPLPAGTIGLMATLLASEFGVPAQIADAEVVTRSLRRYAEYHLERPLKSLSLLATPA